MPVRSFIDIYDSVIETRRRFREIAGPVRHLLDDQFSLYFLSMEIIGPATNETATEVDVLEVFGAVVRRVVASIVLLESGLPQESHSVLRSALELMLIGVDIAHNPESLEKWKATGNDDFLAPERGEWYFKHSKVIKRILANANGVYPHFDQEMVRNINNEWNLSWKMSLHVHSLARIKRLSDGKGNFQLLGIMATEDCEKNFKAYGAFLSNMVSILIGLPKYRACLKNAPKEVVRIFYEKYRAVSCQQMAKMTLHFEAGSKAELQAALKAYGLPLDVGSLPDGAVIEYAVVDFIDPARPKITVKYDEPQEEA